jgi:hypothetical protein
MPVDALNQAATSDSISSSIRRRMMAPFVILLLMISIINAAWDLACLAFTDPVSRLGNYSTPSPCT